MSLMYLVRSVSLMCLVRSVSALCLDNQDRSGAKPLNTKYNVRSISLMYLVVLVASRSTSRAPSTRSTTSFLLVCLVTLCLVVLVEMSRYIRRSTTSCLEVSQRDTTYLTLT